MILVSEELGSVYCEMGGFEAILFYDSKVGVIFPVFFEVIEGEMTQLVVLVVHQLINRSVDEVGPIGKAAIICGSFATNVGGGVIDSGIELLAGKLGCVERPLFLFLNRRFLSL